MKKTGMTTEGVFRRVRFKGGQWYNEIRYGILSEEIGDETFETSIAYN